MKLQYYGLQWTYYIFLFCFLLCFSFLAEKYFDPQPSWFDTLSNSTGCLEIVIHPVRAKDLDAKKTNGSSVKPGNPKISKANEHSQGTASETRAVKDDFFPN